MPSSVDRSWPSFRRTRSGTTYSFRRNPRTMPKRRPSRRRKPSRRGTGRSATRRNEHNSETDGFQGNAMKLMWKFNLVLLAVFIVGFVLTGFISYGVLQANAREEILDNARVMMESVLSSRSYTNTQIKPL